MKKLPFRLSPMVVLLCGTMFSTQVHAQDQLDEIVVTAQKRSESSQKVPLSITALSGDSIRDLGWSSISDALTQVPNVQLDPSNARTSPQFRIRGVGSEDFNVAGQSPVGVYINEVYINNNRGRGAALYDLDRIEVLRGPQGTLWGKNTTAGAIHFVTKRPSWDTEGYALGSIGSIDGRGYTGYIEGAVGGALKDDVLAVRFATKVERTDNWIKNENPNGEDLGGFHSESGRLSLLWKPSSQFDATLIGTYTNFSGEPGVSHNVGTDIYGYSERPGIGYDTNLNSTTFTNRSKVYNLTLSAEWRPSDWTVNSISAFNRVRSRFRTDDDLGPVEGIYWQPPGNADQYSQEVRLSSPVDRPLRGIFGAYFFAENLDSDYDLNFSRVPFDPSDPTGFSVADIFGKQPLVPGADSLVVKSTEDRKRRSYALFASGEYDITPSLTLSGGVRWTWDKESIDLDLLHYWVKGFGTLTYGDPSTALADPLVVLRVRDAKANWNKPTGDATLKWQIDSRNMIYARYARGYRAGQYNITNTAAEDFSLVNPETINAYEAGFKSALFDGRLRLNGSVYTYRYSDIQVYIFTDVGSVALLNGDKAKMTGGELEFTAAPVRNLTLSGGVGYTDAKYGTWVSPVYDRTGNQIPTTPKWTWNVLARYDVPLASGAKVQFQTDWNHKDNFYADPDNTPSGYGGGRTIGNATISFVGPDETFTFRLWVKNLTDKMYATGISFHPVATRVGYGEPRSFGAQFETRF